MHYPKSAKVELSSDERTELAQNVKDNEASIDAITQSQFDEYMNDIDADIDVLMDNNGFEGDNARLYLTGHYLRVWWYDWLGEL